MRFKWALLATALATASFASTASAKIVPQEGIAGMKLGMTAERVIDLKGKPDSDRGDDDGRELRYGKTTALFLAAPDGDQELVGVITRKRSERTAGGSGIGTTEEELAADLPRVECKNIFGGRHCLIGKVKRTRTVTDFLISRKTGRVKRVTVAVITD